MTNENLNPIERVSTFTFKDGSTRVVHRCKMCNALLDCKDCHHAPRSEKESSPCCVYGCLCSSCVMEMTRKNLENKENNRLRRFYNCEHKTPLFPDILTGCHNCNACHHENGCKDSDCDRVAKNKVRPYHSLDTYELEKFLLSPLAYVKNLKDGYIDNLTNRASLATMINRCELLLKHSFFDSHIHYHRPNSMERDFTLILVEFLQGCKKDDSELQAIPQGDLPLSRYFLCNHRDSIKGDSVSCTDCLASGIFPLCNNSQCKRADGVDFLGLEYFLSNDCGLDCNNDSEKYDEFSYLNLDSDEVGEWLSSEIKETDSYCPHELGEEISIEHEYELKESFIDILVDYLSNLRTKKQNVSVEIMDSIAMKMINSCNENIDAECINLIARLNHEQTDHYLKDSQGYNSILLLTYQGDSTPPLKQDDSDVDSVSMESCDNTERTQAVEKIKVICKETRKKITSIIDNTFLDVDSIECKDSLSLRDSAVDSLQQLQNIISEW